MTQFIVAADELLNPSQPNPRLDSGAVSCGLGQGLYLVLVLGQTLLKVEGDTLRVGSERKCAQSVTLANEMECFNLAQFKT